MSSQEQHLQGSGLLDDAVRELVSDLARELPELPPEAFGHVLAELGEYVSASAGDDRRARRIAQRITEAGRNLTAGPTE